MVYVIKGNTYGIRFVPKEHEYMARIGFDGEIVKSYDVEKYIFEQRKRHYIVN